ncbi:hypothetical protein TrVFT333_005224 [Trichoderma virens FT-333]|nr:hypothetical protein TrVFT333_005224 [Trichoderma virens FT-333]
MYQPQYGVPQPSMQPVPYGMPGIQAAAMAATAAASGSSYPYMHPDPSMPHTSPRMPNAKKDGRPSPRMNSISQIPGRRMSQVTSPGVPSAPGMMSHGGPRPPPMPPAPAMQHPQSPEMPAGAVEESPICQCEAVPPNPQATRRPPAPRRAAEADFQGTKAIPPRV